MQFHGFASIAEYERETARFDRTTERQIWHKDGEDYLLLITRANHPSPAEVNTWYLFTADETREVLSGIIPNAEWLERTGGVDRNFTGLLAENGYFRDTPADAAPAPVELYAEDAGGGWQQFALFA